MTQNSHSAISSYSGFIYQGKIALLHCLKLISDNGMAIKNYQLQIDSLDDFAILNEEKVISLHQVKAKRDDLFSSYKGDFDKQKDKLAVCHGDKAYFHVSAPLRSIPETFGDDYPDSQVYKYICDDDSEKTHCLLSEVNQLIEVMLKKALSALNEDEYKLEPAYLELNRNYLEEIICTQVISIHSDIQEKGLSQNTAAYNKRVSFVVLIEALTQEIQESVINNNKYKAFLLKTEFGECLNKFCLEHTPTLNDQKLKKFAYLAFKINSLKDQQLLNFSSFIVPHKPSYNEKASMTNYKNGTFNDDDLNLGFFRLLASIDNNDITYNKNGSNYWLNGSEKFYPTAIREDDELGDHICKKIIEASLGHDEVQFFERDRLVNQKINRESIFSNSISSRFHREEDQSIGDKFSNFKEISLISKDKAKELLDE